MDIEKKSLNILKDYIEYLEKIVIEMADEVGHQITKEDLWEEFARDTKVGEYK